MGELSLGVVPFKEGNAIRVEREDVQTARAMIDTQATKVCGADIMRAKANEGTNFNVRWVPKYILQLDLCVLLEDAIFWQTRPVSINTKPRGHSDSVFSTSAPRKTNQDSQP